MNHIIHFNQDENFSEYYINDNCVCTLDFTKNIFKESEEMTEKEKEYYFDEMTKHRKGIINETDNGCYGIHSDSY